MRKCLLMLVLCFSLAAIPNRVEAKGRLIACVALLALIPASVQIASDFDHQDAFGRAHQQLIKQEKSVEFDGDVEKARLDFARRVQSALFQGDYQAWLRLVDPQSKLSSQKFFEELARKCSNLVWGTEQVEVLSEATDRKFKGLLHEREIEIRFGAPEKIIKVRAKTRVLTKGDYDFLIRRSDLFRAEVIGIEIESSGR